jgi:FtsZ-binding cell division protein ZapB
MMLKKTLFDDNQFVDQSEDIKREAMPLEKLRSLENKIATAIERVKTLKEEKINMERKIKELEGLLNEKNQEVEQLRSEKNGIKSQIEALLNEVETIELE